MKLTIKNFDSNQYLPRKFQEGGAVPTEEPVETQGAPVEEAPQGDPMQELLAACEQAVQSQDCSLAMQVCQALLQMAGGGEATPQAPENQAPVYKAGGKLSRWVEK